MFWGTLVFETLLTTASGVSKTILLNTLRAGDADLRF